MIYVELKRVGNFNFEWENKMVLTTYSSLSDFVLDLVNFSILDEKNVSAFLKRAEKEKVEAVFTDNADGVFSCYLWIKSIKTIKEYEIIEAISIAWAYYCDIESTEILTKLKTCSVLSYSILKGLKTVNG